MFEKPENRVSTSSVLHNKKLVAYITLVVNFLQIQGGLSFILF